MAEENCVKNWLTAAVLEYSCKNNLMPVIEKVLKDQELSSNLHSNFISSDDVFLNEKNKMKPVFLFIQILRGLVSAIETFSTDVSTNYYPWNSGDLPKIINLLEKTYEQCEFISLPKFFTLLSKLKFLDLVHLLMSDGQSAALMQKLYLYYPRWHSDQKSSLAKQFSIDNPKVIDMLENSYTRSRRLTFRLAADTSYRSSYMSTQFPKDMKVIMESVIHLKEAITNLSANAGSTVIEKGFHDELSADSSDIRYQLLFDYLQPEITPEALLRFLDEMEPALEPPSGGFSSCLLPFDTLSDCSDVLMYSDCEESGSEDICDEKEKTLVETNGDSI